MRLTFIKEVIKILRKVSCGLLLKVSRLVGNILSSLTASTVSTWFEKRYFLGHLVMPVYTTSNTLARTNISSEKQPHNNKAITSIQKALDVGRNIGSICTNGTDSCKMETLGARPKQKSNGSWAMLIDLIGSTVLLLLITIELSLLNSANCHLSTTKTYTIVHL